MNKQKFADSLEKSITGFSLSKDGLTIDQLRKNPPESSSVGFTIRLTDGSFFLVSIRKPSDEIADCIDKNKANELKKAERETRGEAREMEGSLIDK